ncbi:O-methyltransferase [Neolewinella litorea]|uniref:O-methyltransferase n=1 Tax=Neolewinella litorea TaxID=2562452 RepID=A0A4S4NLN0_9BACT|nr:O-methyltransferase [Neolewinella litorea]THH39865.1 O-methyltransferase [Neolewinella litorea]
MAWRDRIDPQSEYAGALSGPVPDYLRYVERQTHLKTLAPQMMSGQLQGRLLALLSRLQSPRLILEIGTFTGYASLCLAEGLADDGYLHTIEGDAEAAVMARRHFALSPFADRIILHEGQARAILEDLPGPFDVIFLDGDKRGYPDYYPLLVERLAPGGLLLADNVLWDGKTGRATGDVTARKLKEYNQLAFDDPRMEVVILPIRDGLSISRRRD